LLHSPSISLTLPLFLSDSNSQSPHDHSVFVLRHHICTGTTTQHHCVIFNRPAPVSSRNRPPPLAWAQIVHPSSCPPTLKRQQVAGDATSRASSCILCKPSFSVPTTLLPASDSLAYHYQGLASYGHAPLETPPRLSAHDLADHRSATALLRHFSTYASYSLVQTPSRTIFCVCIRLSSWRSSSAPSIQRHCVPPIPLITTGASTLPGPRAAGLVAQSGRSPLASLQRPYTKTYVGTA
jgi:hypothetical protein